MGALSFLSLQSIDRSMRQDSQRMCCSINILWDRIRRACVVQSTFYETGLAEHVLFSQHSMRQDSQSMCCWITILWDRIRRACVVQSTFYEAGFAEHVLFNNHSMIQDPQSMCCILTILWDRIRRTSAGTELLLDFQLLLRRWGRLARKISARDWRRIHGRSPWFTLNTVERPFLFLLSLLIVLLFVPLAVVLSLSVVSLLFRLQLALSLARKGSTATKITSSLLALHNDLKTVLIKCFQTHF